MSEGVGPRPFKEIRLGSETGSPVIVHDNMPLIGYINHLNTTPGVRLLVTSKVRDFVTLSQQGVYPAGTIITDGEVEGSEVVRSGVWRDGVRLVLAADSPSPTYLAWHSVPPHPDQDLSELNLPRTPEGEHFTHHLRTVLDMKRVRRMLANFPNNSVQLINAPDSRTAREMERWEAAFANLPLDSDK